MSDTLRLAAKLLYRCNNQQVTIDEPGGLPVALLFCGLGDEITASVLLFYTTEGARVW
jgi:hypothetical protein